MTKQELLNILYAERDRVEKQYTLLGWTQWALVAALATLGWTAWGLIDSNKGIKWPIVVIEFFPFDKWLEGRAMQRNKTIIGLSSAVVVVEAGESGGSFDAGKKLFVTKYAVPPVSALGNVKLLQGGASPLAKNPITHQTNLKELWRTMQAPSKCLLFD